MDDTTSEMATDLSEQFLEVGESECPEFEAKTAAVAVVFLRNGHCAGTLRMVVEALSDPEVM